MACAVGRSCQSPPAAQNASMDCVVFFLCGVARWLPSTDKRTTAESRSKDRAVGGWMSGLE